MQIKIIIFSTILLTLCACASTPPIMETNSLDDLKALSQSSTSRHATTSSISRIRLQALKETALLLGAQSGLAYRAKHLNTMLELESKKLDASYNFYALLLHHNILPPVLAVGDNPLNLAAPDTIRLASRVYRIISQARFVTAPPTWRDYLILNFLSPEVPDNTLLPKNRAERAIWNRYVEIGWDNGINQANDIFSENLARLNRDYKGMVLYHKLLAQNMVSEPFVAKTNLGITGDGSKMRIDDQVLRITALPQLNLEGQSWKPGLVPNDPSGKFFRQKVTTTTTEPTEYEKHLWTK